MRVYLTRVGGYFVTMSEFDNFHEVWTLPIASLLPADACSWIVDIKVLLLALSLHFYTETDNINHLERCFQNILYNIYR